MHVACAMTFAGEPPQLSELAPRVEYRETTAQDIVDRLSAADEAEIAVVRMYESTHRKRRTVLEATDKVLRSG